MDLFRDTSLGFENNCTGSATDEQLSNAPENCASSGTAASASGVASGASSYQTVTELGDFGPWVSKLVLSLPDEVGPNDVTPATFNVFCARRERNDGSVLMCREHGAAAAIPSQGYVPIRAAYPCNISGEQMERSTYIALELPEVRLTKRIEGGVMGSRYVASDFRITQLAPLPGTGTPITGLVFNTCTGDVCPALDGWHEDQMRQAVDDIRLAYSYYEPDGAPKGEYATGSHAVPAQSPKRSALIIYLHGAGEGAGSDPKITENGGPRCTEGPSRAVTGNRVSALSQANIQSYFGGAAWVLVPQCPTFWMDDGVEQMGHSGKSIYVRPLKALIDEFIAAHADRIDPNRIVIGGLSNGGFITVRMCLDYPDFFAAGLPCCAPWYDENTTDAVIEALARTPLWFAHSKGDELVDPHETVLPLYAKLAAAGASVHLTYFDHVEDLTGVYREANGSPKKTFNHGVWIHVLNDFCRTEIDDANIMWQGEPVSMWEWAAHQRA